MQQQQAAEATSISTVYPALLGTRWNQRHHNEKIDLIFSVVLFVHDQAEQQMKLKKLNQTKLLFQILASRRKPTWHPVVFVSP